MTDEEIQALRDTLSENHAAGLKQAIADLCALHEVTGSEEDLALLKLFAYASMAMVGMVRFDYCYTSPETIQFNFYMPADVKEKMIEDIEKRDEMRKFYDRFGGEN